MASTNKTANLGLNQWVLSDPLLMEDMNEDNRKIDAAMPFEKILEVTLTQAMGTVELDLSGIDFTKYLEVTLYCTGDVQDYAFTVLLNNITTSNYFYIAEGHNLVYGGVTYMQSNEKAFRFSMHSNVVYIHTDDKFYKMSPNLYPKEFRTISLTCSRSHPKGAKFIMRGVKR